MCSITVSAKKNCGYNNAAALYAGQVEQLAPPILFLFPLNVVTICCTHGIMRVFALPCLFSPSLWIPFYTETHLFEHYSSIHPMKVFVSLEAVCLLLSTVRGLSRCNYCENRPVMDLNQLLLASIVC